MKMKMFLLALPCSALLILGPSSLIAFADEIPCLACAEGSRGQIIFIGGIDFVLGNSRTRVQYTLYNPNWDAEIVITDIRVIDPDGSEPALKPDLLPNLKPIGEKLPKSLPAWHSTVVSFDDLVTRDPTVVPPATSRSQVLFTWESKSNEEVLPLKITGLEFRFEFPHGGSTFGSQAGRNTTHPHLILEIEDRERDRDKGRRKDRDDDDDDDDDDD